MDLKFYKEKFVTCHDESKTHEYIFNTFSYNAQ